MIPAPRIVAMSNSPAVPPEHSREDDPAVDAAEEEVLASFLQGGAAPTDLSGDEVSHRHLTVRLD